MRWTLPILLVALTPIIGCTSSPTHSAAPDGLLTPAQLRCEYGENPLGIDLPHPRLFWTLQSTERALKQSAYRILVASSPAILAADHADLWDSGTVRSDQTTHIAYAGRPLQCSQQVFWKLRVWTQNGQASPWSTVASWTMGLLAPGDWQASWIGAKDPSPQTLLLRRDFSANPNLKRATVHICGLGQYELSINGQRVADDLITPGWSKYDKTCLYDTYDITPLLRTGPNAVGILLANGMYNVRAGRYTKFTGSFGPLRAIAHIRLDYADASTDLLTTDEHWRAHAGPITFSCIYGGEDHDARLELPGWDKPGFDDSSWPTAARVGGPGGKLKGFNHSAPPIHAFETLSPIRITPLKPHIAVYDLGQNVSLIPRIKVRGPAGSSIKITPAELLNADGSVDRRSCGGGDAHWQYTLAGRDTEIWFPRFFYHGLRYLQVERTSPTSELPTIDSLEGVVVHSSSPAVGTFACSNDLFNRIHTLVRWSQRSNMMSVLTDCPHRERLGWLEEYHLNGPSFRYEFDLARLFTKTMTDMADSQLANGLVPDIAPEFTVFSGGFRDSPEWGSAYVLVPWQQYEWTGDIDLLRQHYPGMKRYVEYLGSKSNDHIVSHGLGDWCDVGPKPPGEAQLTPKALTATAFYFLDTRVMADAAKLLGHTDDAAKYDALATGIRDAFNKTFFKPQITQYATGSQCSNSIPLVLDIADPAHRQALLDAIVKDVQSRGNALTAGDVGYRYLLRALADGGRSDVIFDINNQSAKPGYGYQLNKGATSLVESWDARPDTSQNHFMLGHIVEWFYRDLAGISCDPAGPGFKKIIIKPTPVGDITWARATLNTIRGTITSDWKIANGDFELAVTIPPNTTATLFVPTRAPQAMTENGFPAQSSRGVRLLRHEPGRAVFQVTSGQYVFKSPSWLSGDRISLGAIVMPAR